MIGSVPDKILDNNTLYMHLKVLNCEQATEINRLKEKLAIVEKELGNTKIECETFRCITTNSALYCTDALLYVAKLLINLQVDTTSTHAI